MKLIFGLLLASVWLLGYDFSICERYYKEASEQIEYKNVILIEYKRQKMLVGFFPKAPTNAKIIKADPFIGLYAFAPTSTQAQHYNVMPLTSESIAFNMASVSRNSIKRGIILEAQKGFLKYARFSAPTTQNGVISNICYQIYGLGLGENYFIDSKYLLRFLSQKDPYYGDLGFLLYPPSKEEKTLKIEFVNPFFQNNPFLKDDEILSVNHQEFKDYYEFEWFLANLEESSLAQVKIKRQDQILDFEVVVSRRYAGFLLPETFFESIGITLDDELNVVATDPRFSALQQGLVKGDTILWINNQKILNEENQTPKQTHERIRYLLTEGVKLGKLDILISRQGFQFTLNLINGLQNEYIKARLDPFAF